MSNKITTAAELDALPPNSVVIDGWGIAWQKVLYAEPQCWVSWLNPGESSKWLLTRGPSTLIYRPDQPDEATQPSEEQVAPSVDEVVTTMQAYLGNASVTGKWGAAARAIAKLYGSQPTVAQVRAEERKAVAHAWRWGEWTVLIPELRSAEERLRIAQVVTGWLKARLTAEGEAGR